MGIDPVPPPVPDHHEPAASVGEAGPEAADEAVVLGPGPAVPTLVLDGEDGAGGLVGAGQLAQEVRVETPVRLLQEERAALAPDQVSDPEPDAPLLCLRVQPARALELFLAVKAPMRP